jgi:hypothetical protein
MARLDGQCGLTVWWCRAAAAGALFLLSSAVGVKAANAAPVLFLNANMEGEVVAPSGKETYDELLVRWPSGEAGAIPIQYQGGTLMDRFAQVIADPKRGGNNVLQFWLKEARVPGQTEGRHKGRIQMNLADLNAALTYQRFRMYLHPDLALYRAYPKSNTWFTINELWAGVPWKGDEYPFRITLDIVKDRGVGSPLRFAATGSVNTGGEAGSGIWESVWRSVNKDFEVPIGEWLDVELGYKQGGAQTGRFYLAVKRNSDVAKTVVLNVTNWTYHPRAPQPVPLTHWQPLKLYTSSDIIDYVRENGGVAQIYWDDLEIWQAGPR